MRNFISWIIWDGLYAWKDGVAAFWWDCKMGIGIKIGIGMYELLLGRL
jgi:hypothetical protein